MANSKKRKTSYPLAILLSSISTILPIAGVIYLIYVYMSQGKFVEQFGDAARGSMNIRLIIAIILAIVSFVQWMILKQPLKNMYQQAVQDNEYDEFGVSKKKSYQNLTRAEREAMDLQKMADMERLLSSSVLKKVIKQGSSNPEEELNRLVGIEPVKQKTREMVARMRFEQEARKESKKNRKKPLPNNGSMSGRHMVLYGSPGTGKTTLVRILTGFLYQYGYIKENKCVEIDGNFLKAGAESATKTKLIVQKAFDGVLFIDEAYAIVEGTGEFGKEVIATLIKEMEDNRDRFIVILAGYKNDMKRLLDANEGFKSRIKEYLNFPDYTAPEMLQIFELMAQEQGFTVSPAAQRNFNIRVEKERRLSSFGNGRTARNILDESIDKHALNYGMGNLANCGENGLPIKEKEVPYENRMRLCGADVSTEVNENVL